MSAIKKGKIYGKETDHDNIIYVCPGPDISELQS